MAKAASKKEETTEMKAPESKAVAAAPQAQVPQAADEVPEGYWGERPEVGSKERLIPKLLLMQGQSPLVQEGKCMVGQIVNSVTGQVFGSKEKPVLFFPLEKLPSTWVVEDVAPDGTKTFKEIINITAQNENWEWEVKDAKGVVTQKRTYSINFLVMVAEDMDALPYILSFRGTSVKAGKKVVNYFEQSFNDRKPPAANALALSCQQAMNEAKQSYWLFDLLSAKRPANPDELKKSYKWFQTFKANMAAFRFDNSDVEKDDSPQAAPVDQKGQVSANAQY